MADFDRTLPPALAEANSLEYDYADGEGIDLEPYPEFRTSQENARWIRAWTGNAALDGQEYRFFGQDGTGGLAGFWLVREGRPLAEQPVVFFGSEGEMGVVARDLADYLWLLAGGFGPYEAVAYPEEDREPDATFTALAAKHAPALRKPAREVVRLAGEEFPDFEERVRALCR